MDSLNDILSRKDFEEPPESMAIKTYVRERFHTTVGVSVKPDTIIITARSAALAGTLRLHSHELTTTTQTDKRLVFRIG
jgi:hypothetical protein